MTKGITTIDPILYGNWDFYEGEEEKKELRYILLSWKKFLLWKLSDMEQVGEDMWIDKENVYQCIEPSPSSAPKPSSLALKIEMIKK